MLVDPSGARTGAPAAAMSATITPGMLNSASSRPSHIRCMVRCESGPAMRNPSSCRSPLNVRERQSTEAASVSKILSRETFARPMRHLNSAAAAGDMGSRFTVRLLADRRGRVRRSAVWDRAHYVDQRQIADLQRHLGQSGLEPCHYGAGISLLL